MITDLGSGAVHKDGQLTVIDAGHLLRRDRDWSRTTGFTVLCLRGPSSRGIERALNAAFRPSVITLLREPGRALTTTEVSGVLDAPVVEIEYDPAVARSDDAGLLATRLPLSLRNATTAIHRTAAFKTPAA